MGKKGLTLGELLALILIIGILVAILLPVFDWQREKRHRYACAGNLKQLGIVINLYAKENKDRFPPIDDTKNNFIFDANFLFPEYLTDHMIAVCPADRRRNPKTNFRLISDHSTDGTTKGEVHPDCFTGDSYIYLGWMVMGDTETEAFFKAYDDLSPQDYDTDITVPEGWGNGGGDTIHRLYAGVDRWLITDPDTIFTVQPEGGSMVPVVWERPYIDAEQFSHQPDGGYVLYLDGHVDYETMNHRYSLVMSDAFANLLRERPHEPIPHCE
jgi:prepilin-type processing-associated H-X9-DG protein